MLQYSDSTSSVDERVKQLVSKLTLKEKLSLLAGKDLWTWNGIERIGLPESKLTDGPHGVTCSTGAPAVCYPTGIGLASTWNPDLIEKMGIELGMEMHAKGYHYLLGPSVDLYRSPTFGRNYESYSEDPVLSALVASAWVRGVQSQGIGAVPKHIAAYSTNTFMDNVEVDEQALREIYFKVFELIVKESDPVGMMTSYNKINGVPTSEMKSLQSIVKDEWGYKGFIVSDWRGVFSTEALKNGLDVEMPGPGEYLTEEVLKKEIDAGNLSLHRVDNAVSRIVRSLVRCGRLDTQKTDKIGVENTQKQRKLALKIAEESIVLLKNENRLLPLDKHKLKKIAVIGPNASHARVGGGGSAAVSPFYTVSPLDGILNNVSENVEVIVEEGCSLKGNFPVVPEKNLKNVRCTYFEDNLCKGTPSKVHSVKNIEYSWGWVSPEVGIPKNDWSARWEGELICEEAGEYTFSLSYQDGGVQLWIEDELCIDQWKESDESDFEAAYKDSSSQYSRYCDSGQVFKFVIQYRKFANRANLRFEWKQPSNLSQIDKAVETAKKCDVALLFVGLSNLYEGGGMTREDMDLPGEQNELIQKVSAVNSKTIVVFIGGSPVIMNIWLDKVQSLLYAWYPGQEGGNAIANILFGEKCPSAKLPVTIPKKFSDSSAYGHEKAINGEVLYSEGVFIGYRHFDKHKIKPCYPFGYGLSYTTFICDKLKLIQDEKMIVVGELKNTGPAKGAEVIQVYALQNYDTSRPLRSLKAFKKIELDVNECTDFEIELPDDIRKYWSVSEYKWSYGDVEIQVCLGQEEFSLKNLF